MGGCHIQLFETCPLSNAVSVFPHSFFGSPSFRSPLQPTRRNYTPTPPFLMPSPHITLSSLIEYVTWAPSASTHQTPYHFPTSPLPSRHPHPLKPLLYSRIGTKSLCKPSGPEPSTDLPPPIHSFLTTHPHRPSTISSSPPVVPPLSPPLIQYFYPFTILTLILT